ncbi:MAG: helix-turn-helix transcriptional regulator [Spirochaetota bacterium]
MILLIYLLCAGAGFTAIAAYAIFSYQLRERTLGSYAALIASLTILTAADAMYHYVQNVPFAPRVMGSMPWIRISLVVLSQLLFSVLLPRCLSALIRKRIPVIERITVVLFAAVLSTVTVMEALAKTGRNEASVLLLLTLILYGIIRAAVSFSSIPDTLKPFIRIALMLNAAAIAANVVYSLFTLASQKPSYPLGLAFYFLAWNVYNIVALFLILARDHGLRTKMPLTLNGLSDRERQIALLAGEGRTNADIAALFSISIFTVKTHMKSIYKKTGMRTRAQFIAASAKHH